MPARSLAYNEICGVDYFGQGTYTVEVINVLCEMLKVNSTITSLEYARGLEPPHHNSVTSR